MNILSPSILAADFFKLGEQIKVLEEAGVRYLHIDVMDGVFVPAISFGMPVIKSIRKYTDMFFDVHLMIDKPERYIQEFADCGADLINFHLEATTQVREIIAKLRSIGKKVGITIKPATPAESVEPGFGGQKLMPDCLDKVREIRRMIEEKKLHVDLEVDGGINAETLPLALEAGANVIVAGSGVFRDDLAGQVKLFLAQMDSADKA